MNARERYLGTAGFRPLDRTFLLPPWAWGATRERWQSEGLPADVSLAEHFHIDKEGCFPLQVQGAYGPHLHPPLERKIPSDICRRRGGKAFGTTERQGDDDEDVNKEGEYGG